VFTRYTATWLHQRTPGHYTWTAVIGAVSNIATWFAADGT